MKWISDNIIYIITLVVVLIIGIFAYKDSWWYTAGAGVGAFAGSFFTKMWMETMQRRKVQRALEFYRNVFNQAEGFKLDNKSYKYIETPREMADVLYYAMNRGYLRETDDVSVQVAAHYYHKWIEQPAVGKEGLHHLATLIHAAGYSLYIKANPSTKYPDVLSQIED